MIFQSELSNLDTEFSRLQAQLAVLQQQRNLYSQLQQQTEGYLVGLAKLKNQIAETVGGGAIASLKSAVLNLFDPGDNGGNQPIDPTPDTDPIPGGEPEDDDFDIIALDGESGECLTTDNLDDALTKLTYTQAIKRRCSACWGYEVASKGDIKSGFANRTNLGFMEVVNLERSGKEFYETVEAYLDRLYYTGQAREFASVPEFDKPLVAGDRFWHGATWSTGTVIKMVSGDEYLCQIDGAMGEIELNRAPLHYMPTSLEGQTSDIDKAPLTGQSCDWASPFASHLACRRWEDAPLLGQYCAVTFDHNEDKGTSEGEQMPYMELVRHPENSAIAYQRKHDGEIICVYVGFRTKALASSWKQAIEVLTSSVEMRQAKRLEGFKWELKAKGLAMTQINRLATEDLNKSYRPEVGSVKPLSYNPQPKPEAVNPDEVQPGDIVTPLLTPGDSYEVLQVMPNGILDCKSLRTGVQMGMRPGAVSLVQKAQPTERIEFNDLVEVIADGNDCVGLVGSFGRVKVIGESRIGVEIDEQLVYLKPSELRIKAKEEKAPQRTSLQSGQLLMGSRIVTTGKYIGERRVSQLLNAQLGTADKIAAIELAKDLQNLGLDPRLAATVIAGGEVDDASDF